MSRCSTIFAARPRSGSNARPLTIASRRGYARTVRASARRKRGTHDGGDYRSPRGSRDRRSPSPGLGAGTAGTTGRTCTAGGRRHRRAPSYRASTTDATAAARTLPLPGQEMKEPGEGSFHDYRAAILARGDIAAGQEPTPRDPDDLAVHAAQDDVVVLREDVHILKRDPIRTVEHATPVGKSRDD